MERSVKASGGHAAPRPRKTNSHLTVAELCEAIEDRRVTAAQVGNSYILHRKDLRALLLWRKAA
jgi:hypothetical protein